MRTDIMGWMQRIVAAVFIVGLSGLVAAVIMVVRQAEGVPPMPIFAGLVGVAALILLAGACLGLISLAISARRSADALQRIAAGGGRASQPMGQVRSVSPTIPKGASQPATEAEPEPRADEPATATRPARPAGRMLVAER